MDVRKETVTLIVNGMRVKEKITDVHFPSLYDSVWEFKLADGSVVRATGAVTFIIHGGKKEVKV